MIESVPARISFSIEEGMRFASKRVPSHCSRFSQASTTKLLKHGNTRMQHVSWVSLDGVSLSFQGGQDNAPGQIRK